ncbi:MAG: hypothetical protein AAFV07_15495, partial [Bacteroidota bacterium]
MKNIFAPDDAATPKGAAVLFPDRFTLYLPAFMKRVRYAVYSILMVGLIGACKPEPVVVQQRWVGIPNRTWVGEAFWANRLQDWAVQQGLLVCQASSPAKGLRTVHLITHRLENLEQPGHISLEISPFSPNPDQSARAGILLGAGPGLDVMGASLIHQLPGSGAGIFVGIKGDRKLFLYDLDADSLIAETAD